MLKNKFVHVFTKSPKPYIGEPLIHIGTTQWPVDSNMISDMCSQITWQGKRYPLRPPRFVQPASLIQEMAASSAHTHCFSSPPGFLLDLLANSTEGQS